MPDSSSDRPEDIRFISGVLLVSRQPERLMEFYRDVPGLPLAEAGMAILSLIGGASRATRTSRSIPLRTTRTTPRAGDARPAATGGCGWQGRSRRPAAASPGRPSAMIATGL